MTVNLRRVLVGLLALVGIVGMIDLEVLAGDGTAVPVFFLSCFLPSAIASQSWRLTVPHEKTFHKRTNKR